MAIKQERQQIKFRHLPPLNPHDARYDPSVSLWLSSAAPPHAKPPIEKRCRASEAGACKGCSAEAGRRLPDGGLGPMQSSKRIFKNIRMFADVDEIAFRNVDFPRKLMTIKNIDII